MLRSLGVLLLAIALAGPSVSADWLQRAYDASRSEDSQQPGPDWNDVSYAREVPHFKNFLAVVHGQLYLIASTSLDAPGIRIVWKLDLATGEFAPWLTTPRPRTIGASDGERLFLLGGGRLEAFNLTTAALAWAHDLTAVQVATPPTADPEDNPCGYPAIANGTLYVLCIARAAGASVITIQALDAATGTLRWNWTANTNATSLPEQVVGGVSPPASPGSIRPWGVSLVAGWVIGVTMTDVAATGGSPVTGYYWDGWVLTPDGHEPAEPGESGLTGVPGPTEPRFGHHPNFAGFQNAPSPHFPGQVTGDDRIIAFKNDPHEHPASTAANGERLLTLYLPNLVHARELRLAQASDGVDRGMPLLVSNGSIYAAAGPKLWRVDENLNIIWNKTLDAGHYFPLADPVIARDRLYINTADASDHQTLEARDIADGHVLWSQAFDYGGPTPILSDRFLIAMSNYNIILVYGQTPLSLHPDLAVSDTSPRVGASLTVDLSRTGPGANGTATGFRADWGDGSASDWSPEPRLSHTYAAAGDHAARFYTRNDARQTASVPLTFHVQQGGVAPSGADAFPWFPLLGLVAVGGAIGGGALLLRRREEQADVPTAGAAARGVVVAPGATVLGKYRVERELGAGGGGRAFLARDVRMKRRVVLKLIASIDPEAALREARTAAAIEHPNVVRVYDVEDLGTKALLVMEYVDGGSLKDRLAASGPLSDAAFLRVADDLLAALDAVHAAGMVHRDVKPGNVLLTRDGHAKLSDFGVARLPGFQTTMGDTAPGSVQYMAPEQARGKRVTPLSDLYSAAATLYEARTGHALVEPLADESAIEVQMRVGNGRAFDREVEPPALRAWFARALAPAPEDRFASAGEMRQALVDALGQRR